MELELSIFSFIATISFGDVLPVIAATVIPVFRHTE